MMGEFTPEHEKMMGCDIGWLLQVRVMTTGELCLYKSTGFRNFSAPNCDKFCLCQPIEAPEVA
jgi:hypothetical protein